MNGVRTHSLSTLSEPELAFGRDDDGACELAAHGYLQEEHLFSGTACGRPFTTRLLIRRPGDPARMSGMAIVEPMHLEGGRPIWATIHRHLMRSGHVWMEIACQRSPAYARMLAYDPERYRDIALAAGDPAESPVPVGEDPRAERDAFIAWWWWSSPQLVQLCGQALAALRVGEVVDPAPRRTVLAGISQTGGIVRRIARALADGELLSESAPDGLLACNSGGGEPMATPLPSVELLAEADLESVRAAAGLPGQGRGLLHRQPDSARFRLYEVAGMAHMDSRRVRRDPPPGKRWSRFPHAEVMAATLEQLLAWIDLGLTPSSGAILSTDSESGQLERDRNGHAIGGVRTVATAVPCAFLQPLGDDGRAFPFGCETAMTEQEVIERYGSVERWSSLARKRAAELVAEGWLRPEDLEAWR